MPWRRFCTVPPSTIAWRMNQVSASSISSCCSDTVSMCSCSPVVVSQLTGEPAPVAWHQAWIDQARSSGLGKAALPLAATSGSWRSREPRRSRSRVGAPSWDVRGASMSSPTSTRVLRIRSVWGSTGIPSSVVLGK